MFQLQRCFLIAGLSLAVLGRASGQNTVPSPISASPGAAPPPPSAAVLELRQDLERIIRGAGWRDARHSVMVVSLERGDTLFAHQPDLPMAPASNMKLFSTAAALYFLGPDFRYSTYVLGRGEINDSVLAGDLILYGTGDPAISGRMLQSAQAVLRDLADSVAAQGIREVQGDLIGDGSYFDDTWIGPGWDDDDRMAWYAAPVGALSFAENLVSVRVLPGDRAGAPARIQTVPETRGLAIVNRVRTVSRGATRVRFEHGPDRLIVEGQIGRRHGGTARSIPIVDPTNYAAAAFRAALESRGVRVSGSVRTVRRSDSSAVAMAAGSGTQSDASVPPRVLAVHLSPTLGQLATLTNQISHNLFAEALLKTTGRVAVGDGSFQGGARAVRYFLECEAQVDSAALRIVDGSGLSDLNRVTARTTIQLLGFMRRSEVWESFYASLPQAATPHRLQHSLRHRMGGTAAAGNLRAKTGTISRVSSLSGYVRAATGELLAFSIYANGVPSTAQAKWIEDRIGARLASFARPADDGASASVDSTAERREEAPTDTAAATEVRQPGAAVRRDTVAVRPAKEPRNQAAAAS